MSHHQPIGGRLFTAPFLFLGILAVIALVLLVDRFANGLAAVTNLNDGYPWGIWVVYDIVVGTGFACGGYVLALTVYIANKGKYHPLVRPALLASLFGYSLGGLGAVIDMGRYWNFYQMFNPAQMNLNSVMLEVGLCVSAYSLVLFIEFLPVILEKFRADVWRARLEKVLFIFIAIGVLLPTMHQSSLGSLLIAMGHKVDPLWQAQQLMPLLAIMTAMLMGFCIVIFEGSMAAVGLRQPSETHLHRGLIKVIVGLVAAYLVIRFGDLIRRGALGGAFEGDLQGNMFLLETALFVVPLLILGSSRFNRQGRFLLIAAVSLLLAGATYRFNAFLVGFDPGAGYVYFPSAAELMVSIGIVAIEIMGYLFFVKLFPVMPKHQQAHA
ncbi:Ni/Fe-hydrogenase cytochrome b subunit [Motiliproteus sp. SC1-56]|uniref:Ni/Fe-hydrogenase cytochrome b subunit n=1 Tax=Motiliproteus sp. SC1-56 TaxID=2799565 RepID=UPI001A8CF9BC|nr:Ni/Fe-hydrogenase cytochrome b subunit [Motiliproteus sp. SC1-56]